MDDLQYLGKNVELYSEEIERCFKPCYKWMTFNTILDNYPILKMQEDLF